MIENSYTSSWPVIQVIILPEEDKELPESIEAQNGLTPAMRNARKRRFRHPRLVDPKVIREVEEAILKISGVNACCHRYCLHLCPCGKFA